jgi:hypothetical protein
LRNASLGTSHYLVDVLGYYRKPPSAVATSGVLPVPPKRVLDTAQSGTPVPPKTAIRVQVGGQGDVPASGVSSVALLLSARAATQPGFLTVYADGAAAPDPSSVQFPAGGTGFNLVWTKTSAAGAIQIYNGSDSTVQLWGDVYAYSEAATRPDPPSGVVASPGDQLATVTWQAPFDGGTRITKYTITAKPGGATATVSSGTTATVTGLTNGTAYTFTVTATNSIGASQPSAPSAPATPADPQPPGRPLVTEVYPRDGAVRVSWSPPDTGSAAVSEYRIVASPSGTTVTAPSNTTETVVSGLTNGTTYTFTVTAVNANGAGQPSPVSDPVSPRPADVPVQPLITAAVPMDGRIDVQWAPASDGGAPITGYTVTAQPGAHRVDTPADTTVVSVGGLTNGTGYTITVVANNKAGTSPAATTGPLTPNATRAPATPTDVRASVTGAGAVTVSWTPPDDFGTAAITGYTVTAAGTGGKTVTTGQTSITITGLRTDTGYTFSVAATNQHGTGQTSPATEPVVPALSVKATPVVLSEASLNALQQVHSDGTLDFASPPAQITALRPGGFVIITAHPKVPDGLFRKVAEVRQRDGLVVVSTVKAGLDEVLGAGGLTYDETIDATDIQTFTPASPGVSLVQPTIGGRTRAQGAPGVTPQGGVEVGIRNGEAVLKFSVDTGPGAPSAWLEAEAGLRPLLSGGIDIGATGVKTHLRVGAKVRANVQLRAGLGGKFEEEIPLGSFTTAPIIIPAGPAPIVLVPVLEFAAKVTLEGQVGVQMSASYSRVLDVSMRTENATVTGIEILNEPGPDNKLDDIKAYGTASATAGVSVNLSLKLYGVAGPGISAGPYVKAAVDTTANPWWEVRAGISAKVFLKLGLFSFDISQDWTIADVSSRLAAADGAWDGIAILPGSADVGLNETVQFTVTALESPPPVRWEVVSGPGFVDQNGRYISNQRGVAEIEATPTEGNAAPTRAGVRVGARPGTPQVRVAPAPRSLKVSWPAVAPGDSPVTEYAVTTEPPTRTVYVPAEDGKTNYQTYFQNLDPRIAYYVTVTAVSLTLNADSPAVGPTYPGGALTRIGSAVLISTDAYGNPDNTERAGKQGAFLSGNGRYAFFSTYAKSNLAPPDIANPNSVAVYLLRKDLITGEIVLASRGLDGHTPVSLPSYGALPTDFPWRSSADGNIVAYMVYQRVSGEVRWRILVHNIAAQSTWDATASVSPALDAMWPRLSDSGEIVAYMVNTPTGAPALNWILWRVARGGTPQQITRCVGFAACHYQYHEYGMSSDGNRIVYNLTEERDYPLPEYSIPILWQAPGQWTNLMPNRRTREDASRPVISPDGSLVAVWYQNTEPSPDIAGIAVAPISAGTINSSHVVARNDPEFPDLLNPVDLSRNEGSGYLLGYNSGQRSTAYQAETYDPRSSTNGPIASSGTGTHGWLNISDDANLAVWTQRCDQDLSCRPGVTPGVWAQRMG